MEFVIAFWLGVIGFVWSWQHQEERQRKAEKRADEQKRAFYERNKAARAAALAARPISIYRGPNQGL